MGHATNAGADGLVHDSELQKRNGLCVLIMESQANRNGRQVARPPSQNELRKQNAICVFVTEVQANGNGGHVMRPPSQSDLRKRNAICVFITELQANGNGRQIARPPPQSELRKRNATCVLIMELQANGNGRQVTQPPPQSELWKQNAICVNCRRMAIADSSCGLLRKVSRGSGTPHVRLGRKCRRMGTAENKVAMAGESAGRLYALAFDVYVSSIPLEY